MTNQPAYFEKLSFKSYFLFFFKVSSHKKISNIFFIDASISSKRFLIPLLNFLGKKTSQLGFQMMEIVDKNGELITTRIRRKDLFIFQEKIFKSKAYKFLYSESWNQDSLIDYINKGLASNSIIDSDSVARMLYLVNVIDFDMQRNTYQKSIFISKKRPWFDLFQEYADQHNIRIFEIRDSSFTIVNLKKIIRNYPLLYKLIKNLKYGLKQKNININLNSSISKLFLDGRGDINLINDGMHSDFFWQINSNFQLKSVLCKHFSDDEKDYFIKHNISSIGEGAYLNANELTNYNQPTLNYSREFKYEYNLIKSILNSYVLERFNNVSLFKKYGVKVFFSWDKYSNDHIAWSQAIKDNNGISVNWQMAFDGFCNTECLINSDIVFSYSKFSTEIDKKIKSKIKYNVITGYPKDYATALLIDNANQVRVKLEKNGAKKIVFVIDENSIDDSRWHTGHELQRENYSFILEKVLEIPWLGVIFKPKRAINLRQRLGHIEKLLDKALVTGRCHIFEDSGRHTTSAPPILAGLAADVCIHGHLNAGTAALECAFEGKPTLLIDREGAPYSKLYDLPKGKVIFHDWPSAIDALIDHFNTPNGIDGFGDWSSIIDELDPFRDGLAAYRMGTYLKWLVDGFDKGIDREDIMSNAASKYKELWGEDKVISS